MERKTKGAEQCILWIDKKLALGPHFGGRSLEASSRSASANMPVCFQIQLLINLKGFKAQGVVEYTRAERFPLTFKPRPALGPQFKETRPLECICRNGNLFDDRAIEILFEKEYPEVQFQTRVPE
jgi:hypothetical protein